MEYKQALIQTPQAFPGVTIGQGLQQIQTLIVVQNYLATIARVLVGDFTS